MNFENYKQIIKSPLGQRLFILLLLFGIFTAIVLTLINTTREYKNEMGVLVKQYSVIENHDLAALNLSVWATNPDETALLLRGLLGKKYIEYVEIKNPNGELWLSAGSPVSEEVRKREFNLLHTRAGKTYDLGVLSVTSSIDDVLEEVYGYALELLIINIILMIFVSVFIFILFDYLVTRHIINTVNYIDAFDLEYDSSDLSLKRAPSKKLDELDRLVTSINGLKKTSSVFLKKLRESEEKYKAIADYTYDWESWHLPGGEVYWINPAVERITGYSVEECKAMDRYPVPIIAEDDRELASSMLDGMIENRTTGNDQTFRIKKKDKSYGWIAMSWQPIFGSLGNYLGIRSSIRDISERMDAEASLSDSELRHRTLVENIPGVSYRCLNDADYTMIFISSGIYDLSGYPSSDFIENSVRSFADIIFPDDIDLVSEAVAIGVKNNSSYSVKYRIVRSDGLLCHVLEKGQATYNQDGSVNTLEGVIIDITKQEVSENKLAYQQHEQALILNTMVDAVISIDKKGDILSINNSATDIFGYSEDQLLNTNIKKLMPIEHAKKHDKYVSNYISTGKSKIMGKGREIKGVRSDGEEFPMRVSVAELPRKPGEIERYVGVCHDISEEKEQEEVIRRTQKMDALGKLTGGIAHDFNNALGIIIGYSALLMSKCELDKKSIGYVKEIRNAGERSKNLTSKLLSFASSEEVMQKQENVNELLAQQQNMLEKTLTAKIELTLALCETPWFVWIDSSAFEDAILNISINAMHAMPNGGSYTISTSNESLSIRDAMKCDLEPGEYVMISLKDTGVGMTSAVIEKIFDPFFSTKGNDGTGLGMSQVFGFAKQAGGAVEVESTPGKGALLKLYLPRYIAEQGDGYDGDDDGNELGYDAKLKGSETVLIVDDEESLLRLSEELLSSCGYKVLTALNGDDALGILNSESIDLLITDIIMPKMDGNQLVAKALEKFPNLKVQMLSGYSDQVNNHLVDNNLHIRRIQKPYSNENFLLAVRELLDEL